MPKPVVVAVAVLGLAAAACGRTNVVTLPATALPTARSTTTTTIASVAPKATFAVPTTSPRSTTSTTSVTLTAPPTTAASSTTVPLVVTGSLRDHLVDSTVVPPGFVGGSIDDGLVNAPAKRESVGRRWSRLGPGGTADDLSVAVTRFPTPAAATNFNTAFAQEYATNGVLLRSEPVSGVPGGVAYLNQPHQGTAWFTVGDVAAMVFVVDASDDPLMLAETLARAEYQALLRT